MELITTRKAGKIIAVICLLFTSLAGNSQYALQFSKAGSQYVTVPHSASLNLTTTFTMEARVNYSGANNTIVDKGNYDYLWSLNANDNGNNLLFRSRPPVADGSRTFPDMAVILAGYPADPPEVMGGLKGETLPTGARAMRFRLTVRDNRAGGGGVMTGGGHETTLPNGTVIGGYGCGDFSSTFQINVVDTGPFLIAAPNGGGSYAGGLPHRFTWNVAGTEAAPINCSHVRISLSTDGGLTYPTELIASTPNDGSESIVLPNIATSTARIKIEAVDNIFFDISEADFTITETLLISIDDVTLAEGNAGTTDFTFTVSLSEPAGPGGVSFDIATLNHTATTADNDYTEKSLTSQFIPQGSSTYTFSVQVKGDNVLEPDEIFYVYIERNRRNCR